MENRSRSGVLSKKFLFFVLIVAVALVLSSCVLIKDNTKPLISNFTKSATLLSQHFIRFSANVIDTGSGLENVIFEINGSPLPTTKEGTNLFVANWFAVYGSYRVTVLAQDRAGNLATQTDSFFVMDSTPPVIKVISASTVAKGMSFPIKVTAYDPQSGVKNVEIEVDGEKVHTLSRVFEWSFSQKGLHTVSVTAVNGQGLISRKSVKVNVVDASKIPPYVQVVEYPKVVESGKPATFVVYAYSYLGIKGVKLDVGSKYEGVVRKGNLYTFRVNIPSEKSGLLTATCIVYEATRKWEITKQFFVLSPSATIGISFPSHFPKIVANTMVRIPFFMGEKKEKTNFSARVDGIPVDVEGTFPKFFVLWNGKAGKHVLTISVNGKIVGKKVFLCHGKSKGEK